MSTNTTIRRTVKVKLELEEKERSKLQETISQYLWAANYVVETAWPDHTDSPRTVNREELHEQTYTPVRENTELHSSHVQLARDRAIEALKAVKKHREKGISAGRPRFDSFFLDFNTNSASVNSQYASLSTVDGRVEAEFILPTSTDNPHHWYLQDDAFDVTRSTLVSGQDRFYLHVSLKKQYSVKDRDLDQPAILGVDLGVSNLAVSSTGRFWTGGEITHLREEYNKRRRSLQKCGTRWAHEHIQSISRKLRSQVKERLNTVAKELVDEAKRNDCVIIAFEDLSYISSRMDRWDNIRRWAYRTFIQTVEYKAKVHGISVTRVDPENTSTRCSTCGYIDKDNRNQRAEFHCVKCGYENHADYNAAKNIGLKQLRHSQNGSDGGAPVGVRVNSGIITDSGYKPIS